jgi:hypothetical protein
LHTVGRSISGSSLQNLHIAAVTFDKAALRCHFTPKRLYSRAAAPQPIAKSNSCTRNGFVEDLVNASTGRRQVLGDFSNSL